MAKGAAIENPNPRFGGSSSRPMAEMELDAALALAEMAKMEEESGGRNSKMRTDDGGSPDLIDTISSKSKHALVDDDPQDSEVSAAVEEERVKVEQNSELSTSNVSCPISQMSSFARRTKQNMTEAEKEARRIRRVLANRESARQTIRRRQAVREELTKRVADLSLDNENMKREKELIMKEYVSLKDRNKELKKQMAKTTKREVEVGVEINSSQLETSPSTELSLLTSSKPAFTPYVRSSQPVLVSSETTGCYEEGNPCQASPVANLYVPAHDAWFYPLHHHTSQNGRPSSHSHNDQDADSITQCCRTRTNADCIHERSKPGVPLTATTCIEERTTTGINLEELPVECDERDQDVATCLPAYVVPNPSSSGEGGLLVDAKVEEMEIPVPERGQVTFVQSHEASIDLAAAAAAEARKRRRELKKLKFVHTRQIRLHS
ncbi:uncharacterized protein M6B38_114095 [Iris pallida]|uniref:BZIP domain-containing protein n=1 Tax=Iris pallida TaxID=29817 RepID=A0AAX6IKZ9_IRIPA|nr:uncharacterized protein M6B38_114095 [Iris pallida]